MCSSMYGYTVHVKRFVVGVTVTILVTAGFPFDDESTVNSQDELPWMPPGHTASGAVRTRECNYEL